MKYVKISNLAMALILFMVGCEITRKNVVQQRPQITCPVMRGHVINCGIDKEVYTDYKGKLVYFCSEGCREEFWKDPKKYIKLLENEGVTLEEALGSEGS